MAMIHQGPPHWLPPARRPTLCPRASFDCGRKELGLQLRTEQFVLLGDGQGMVREAFLEEVSFEDREEQGYAFQGLKWPTKMHRDVRALGLPGTDV